MNYEVTYTEGIHVIKEKVEDIFGVEMTALAIKFSGAEGAVLIVNNRDFMSAKEIVLCGEKPEEKIMGNQSVSDLCSNKAKEIKMNFGQAIEALKEGNKVKRAIWGGHWFLAKNPVATQQVGDGYESKFSFENGLIVAELKDMGGCAPAQAYQADILAEDWEVIK